MVIHYALAQTRSSLKQLGSIITFFVLLIIMLQNFVHNVLLYQGTDVLAMIHPMELLTLSPNAADPEWLSIFMQIYPLLVTLPSVLSFNRERQTGESILIAARMGNLQYTLGRLVSVFLTTFVVFTVPFLIEIPLNCISFPLEAQGDVLSMDLYDPGYVDYIHCFLFSNIYIFSPYVYAVVGTLFWGFCSAVFAAFAAAFVACIKFKYTVFSMLPAFLFLNATVMFSPTTRDVPSIAWYHYLFLFDDRLKNPSYLWAIPILILISILGTVWGGTHDCIG